MQAGKHQVTVIVPVLNELKNLPSLISSLIDQPIYELVIVDGGSNDGSIEWLESFHVDETRDFERIQVVKSAAGRARQMNEGAARATGTLLLFLHADTRLPSKFTELLPSPDAKTAVWGWFDVKLAVTQGRFSLPLRIIAFFMNQRARLTKVATGDQALFVERDLFERIGRFDALPLMEDVAISKKLRRCVLPHCISELVVSSGRRWEKHGVLKTVLLMWMLRFGYFIGISPLRLNRFYRHVR